MCFQLSSNAFNQTDVWVFISQSVWAQAERIQSSTEHSLLPYRTHTSHICQEPELFSTLPCCIFPMLLKNKRMSYQPFLAVCQTSFLHATPLTCSSEHLLCQYVGSGNIRVNFYCIMPAGFNCRFLQMMLLLLQAR